MVLIKLLVCFMFAVLEANAMEFYYTLMRNSEQCFEEHLSARTLVTGEVFFTRSGSLTLTVLNPRDKKVLIKVQHCIYLQIGIGRKQEQ